MGRKSIIGKIRKRLADCGDGQEHVDTPCLITGPGEATICIPAIGVHVSGATLLAVLTSIFDRKYPDQKEPPVCISNIPPDINDFTSLTLVVESVAGGSDCTPFFTVNFRALYRNPALEEGDRVELTWAAVGYPTLNFLENGTEERGAFQIRNTKHYAYVTVTLPDGSKETYYFQAATLLPTKE